MINCVEFFILLSYITASAYCNSGRTLIWSDEFDSLDESKWSHEVTTYPLVNFILGLVTLKTFLKIRKTSTMCVTTVPTAGCLMGCCTSCQPSLLMSMERSSSTLESWTCMRRILTIPAILGGTRTTSATAALERTLSSQCSWQN